MNLSSFTRTAIFVLNTFVNMLRMLMCFSFYWKLYSYQNYQNYRNSMFVVSVFFIFNDDSSLQKEQMIVGPRKGVFCRIIKSIYHSKVHWLSFASPTPLPRWSSDCDLMINDDHLIVIISGSNLRLDNWPLFWVESFVLICLWTCQEIIPSLCSCFENCTPVDNWLCLSDGGEYFHISYFVLFITSSLQ